MIMNMPAEVILPELMVIFSAAADDVIKGIQTKILRLPQMGNQRLVFDAAAQRPDGIHKGKICSFVPCSAQVVDLMRMGTSNEINGSITDQQNCITIGDVLVAGQWLEHGRHPLLCQQNSQEIDTGQGSGIAQNLFDLFERLPMRK